MSPLVLVVDDDPTVSDVVRRYLERSEMRVAVYPDGLQALEAALLDPPDLVILDLMLPSMDGLEVFRRLRAQTPVPVIMLTARGDEADRLVGLELGADDYITKPFSPRELVLRVRSVLRRATAPTPDTVAPLLVDGELSIDVTAHQAHLGETALRLTPREYDLLLFLFEHPRRAFSREELLLHVWGWQYADHTTVTVHVRRLREKIEPNPRSPVRLITVFGVGYRYEPMDPP